MHILDGKIQTNTNHSNFMTMSGILASSVQPYVIDFSEPTIRTKSEDLLDLKDLANYCEVEPHNTKNQEFLGHGNSLFLAIARAIILTANFHDEPHSILSKKTNKSTKMNHILMSSDVYLQEILRKTLCLHWLRNLDTEKFELKYSKYEF